MDYLWLKAIHIAAVITWVGGMLVVAVTTTAFSAVAYDEAEARRGAFFAQVRRWDQRVTTPAMLLVWAFGLALAVTGQWLSQPWLLAKIALVIVLSGLHGMLSDGLRRLALGQPSRGAGKIRFAAAGIIGLVFVVVILVVSKPF
ncbi:CopD family protein [Mesorhizobium shangrilense]|uniref:Protoporphyrinogen IX oxidase n=1 Tax=Mesorhizobium shangrilense TaxID=460060 RepID=A0ABV2DGX3_9HYPH